MREGIIKKLRPNQYNTMLLLAEIKEEFGRHFDLGYTWVDYHLRPNRYYGDIHRSLYDKLLTQILPVNDRHWVGFELGALLTLADAEDMISEMEKIGALDVGKISSLIEQLSDELGLVYPLFNSAASPSYSRNAFFLNAYLAQVIRVFSEMERCETGIEGLEEIGVRLECAVGELQELMKKWTVDSDKTDKLAALQKELRELRGRKLDRIHAAFWNDQEKAYVDINWSEFERSLKRLLFVDTSSLFKQMNFFAKADRALKRMKQSSTHSSPVEIPAKIILNGKPASEEEIRAKVKEMLRGEFIFNARVCYPNLLTKSRSIIGILKTLSLLKRCLKVSRIPMSGLI